MVSKLTAIRSRVAILGAALVVVMAFGAVSAGAASAETATWTIGGKALTGTETTEVQGGQVQFVIPAAGLSYTCKAVEAAGSISSGGKGDAQSLTFTGCVVDSAEGSCKIHTRGALNGVMRSSGVTATATKVGGSVYEVFAPKEGTILFPLVVEKVTGHTCPAAGSYNWNGTMAAQLGPEAVELGLTFSQAISEAAGASLTFGANLVFPAGSAVQSLTGANAGYTFGAI
jgi:hypothetical protein